MLRSSINRNYLKNILPSLYRNVWSDSRSETSDGINFDLNRQDQTRKSRNQKDDPENTTFIFFPGQGAQYVGMAKDLLKYRAVKDMFGIANEILGYDLLKICLNGPQEKLNETIYCQPAVFVASLASLELLKEKHPGSIEACVAAAGFSLGELTALTFAGAFSFDKGKVNKFQLASWNENQIDE